MSCLETRLRVGVVEGVGGGWCGGRMVVGEGKMVVGGGGWWWVGVLNFT